MPSSGIEPPPSPGWFAIIVAAITAVGGVVTAVLRRPAVNTDAARQEIERLVQLYRILEEEKSKTLELLKLSEQRNRALIAHCTHTECPNHPSRKIAVDGEKDA